MADYPEVLVLQPDTSLEELGAFVHGETYAEFSARGRVGDCNCSLIQCVCEEARSHGEGCPFRRALTCAVGIDCEKHGFDVCPECDPCTCGP